MGHKKLIRFEAIKQFENVLEYPENMPGKWNQFFKNDHPLTLELACGKGEYTLGLARLHPDQNFIGVDLKGNRIWAGAKKALEEELVNAAFLVSEIWITFPDPQLRISKAKKRLTHPRFLRIYQQFLRPDGYIHLKTDSPTLYEFTRKVCEMYECKIHRAENDLYRNSAALSDELKIRTYYESLNIAGSDRIHYLCFSLPAKLPAISLDIDLQERLRHEEKGAD